MKKIVALLGIVLVSTSLVAQSHRKPSAAIRDSASREHRLPPAAVPDAPEEDRTPSLRSKPGHNETEIPLGTAIRIRLETPISTSENKAGDPFSGSVTEAVLVGGKEVIPVGASVTGHVERTSEPRRIAGRPTIAIRPESVRLPSGESLVLNAVVVDTDAKKISVDDEGRMKGAGFSRRDALEMTIGTGGGATMGAIIAGTKGTLVGATVGAAATVTAWMARRHSAELPAGTEIIIELNRPMQLQGSNSHSGY